MSSNLVALIALFLMFGYVAATGWFISMRRKEDALLASVRTAVHHVKGSSKSQSYFQARINKKNEEMQSTYRRVERLIGVDPYEALYYPVKQWAVILFAIFDAIAIEVYCRFFLGYSVLFYELALPFLVGFLLRIFFNIFHTRRRDKLVAQLPEILDTISRSISVGQPAEEALRIVSMDIAEPSRTEFKKLVDSVSVGVSLSDATRTLATNNKISEYQFLAIAISLQATAGGSIVAALENVSRVVRDRVTIKQKGRALTGEARGSAMILTLLPIVTLGFMLIAAPSYAGKMIFTQSGRHFVGIATVFLTFGQSIMRWMINSTMRSAK